MIIIDKPEIVELIDVAKSIQDEKQFSLKFKTDQKIATKKRYNKRMEK